jgi:hypothetical protein
MSEIAYWAGGMRNVGFSARPNDTRFSARNPGQPLDHFIHFGGF